MPQSKSAWRQKLNQILGELQQTDSIQKNLHHNLLVFFKNQKGIWGSYSAFSKEPNLAKVLDGIVGCQWAYPKMESDHEFHFWLPGPKGFSKSKLGFLEPVADGAKRIEKKELKGLLIPGLGFDAKGNRLGRGKGHYDRFLRGFGGIKVGIGYEAQMVSELPSEDHDIQMDFIVTDKKVYRCGH
jgi:5-formyltetrahydrofolate cyclo-ligase